MNIIINERNPITSEKKSKVIECFSKDYDNDIIIPSSWEVIDIVNTILPPNLSGIIEEYTQNKSVEDLYKRVMDGMSIPEKDRIEMDFYNEKFVIRLYQILATSKKIIPKYDYLWFDLERLLFKRIIHERRIFMNNDDEFNEASKNLELLSTIVVTNHWDRFADFNISFKKEGSYVSSTLIKDELLENPHAFHLFGSAIKNVYIEKIISTKEQLMDKYFNGNSHSNLILKCLMLMYDPQYELRKLFSDHDQEAFPRVIPLVDTVTLAYAEEIQTEGPNELQVSQIGLTSDSMIKYFLKVNKRFLINDSNGLVIILKKLQRSKLLLAKPLNEIIGFEKLGLGSSSWNKRFTNLLNEQKEKITHSEYLLFSSLIIK